MTGTFWDLHGWCEEPHEHGGVYYWRGDYGEPVAFVDVDERVGVTEVGGDIHAAELHEILERYLARKDSEAVHEPGDDGEPGEGDVDECNHYSIHSNDGLFKCLECGATLHVEILERYLARKARAAAEPDRRHPPRPMTAACGRCICATPSPALAWCRECNGHLECQANCRAAPQLPGPDYVWACETCDRPLTEATVDRIGNFCRRAAHGGPGCRFRVWSSGGKTGWHWCTAEATQGGYEDEDAAVAAAKAYLKEPIP
jgi:hypothetical protein